MLLLGCLPAGDTSGPSEEASPAHPVRHSLRQDPGETEDRAADDPAIRSRYQALLERWSATRQEVPVELDSDPEIVEQLRALGYIP